MRSLQRLFAGRGRGQRRIPRRAPRHGRRPPHRSRAAPHRGRRAPQGARPGAGPRPPHEGLGRRMAVGPAQAYHLLHRRAARRLPSPGAGSRRAVPHAHRAAPDRGARRGEAPGRDRPLRAPTVHRELAARRPAGQPLPGEGPGALLESNANFGALRPTALLPPLRARLLRRAAQALPQGGEGRAYRQRPRTCAGGRHLPRTRDVARRGREHERRFPRPPQDLVPKFFITTAIDYSNGDPHLGHALEKVGADCIARYRRLRGDDVRFLMGMDEHSQSVIQAAARAGVTPREWVDRMAGLFSDYWARLACSNDDWIRTTEPRHVKGVVALLERIRQRRPDDLFVADYEGLYCTGCEEFKQGAQIVDGHCIEHPTLTLIPTKERNHFFRLSGYRAAVLERIRSGVLAVEPEIRRNEVVRLLEAGLQDISISRQRQPWGIPFPGDPQQTVYVWFDALINYLSATGFPEAGYDRLWPADLHVVGKGITRFHCVIWPAMLLAAELPPPRAVWAHGYVQWSGAKMSKTAGTAVTLGEAIDRHGADALRYFLLREVGFDNDGDFTWERFDARYTADLADTIGNLVSRSLAMIHRYRDGTVPRAGRSIGSPFDKGVQDAEAVYGDCMDANRLADGAGQLIAIAASANRYIEEQAPWKLAKEARHAELDVVLANLARTVVRLAILAYPFIPEKAEAVWGLVCRGLPLTPKSFEEAVLGVEGRGVDKPPILFPKPHLAPA